MTPETQNLHDAIVALVVSESEHSLVVQDAIKTMVRMLVRATR